MRLINVILFVMLIAGCTSSSTRQAITSYEQTQHQQHLQFAYMYKQANQMLFLSSWNALKATTNDADRLEVLKKYAMARSNIEESRLQYERIRANSLAVVGVYLYNSQGWANAVFQDRADLLGRGMEAIDIGNKAAGVESIRELFQTSPTAPAAGAINATPGVSADWADLVKKYGKLLE